MEDPGRQLRRIREALRLKYRDVEEASQIIARLRENQEFAIGLSRLADIENKGTLPSLYRVYSLCAIYGLNFETVLQWYGILLGGLMSDASRLPIKHTRLANFGGSNSNSESLEECDSKPLDLTRTLILNARLRKAWKGTLNERSDGEGRHQKHALIGTEDWFMFPILPPGCLVEIDETKRKIWNSVSQEEYEWPIYLVEHRAGYRCGWCTKTNGLLILQPHSGSGMNLEVYKFPGEIEVLGQVVGVTKRLDQAKRRHTRF